MTLLTKETASLSFSSERLRRITPRGARAINKQVVALWYFVHVVVAQRWIDRELSKTYLASSSRSATFITFSLEFKINNVPPTPLSIYGSRNAISSRCQLAFRCYGATAWLSTKTFFNPTYVK